MARLSSSFLSRFFFPSPPIFPRLSLISSIPIIPEIPSNRYLDDNLGGVESCAADVATADILDI